MRVETHGLEVHIDSDPFHVEVQDPEVGKIFEGSDLPLLDIYQQYMDGLISAEEMGLNMVGWFERNR